ncbi:MAG TPA: L,D-transpeptidase family protein [Ignavibacteriaceae bacterium]|nr:L,D-transpeptidase family protein [Ignavibacteriaceae bacterium]
MINSKEGITISVIVKHIIVLGFLLFLLSACEKKTVETEKSLNEKLNFSSTEYLNVFKSKIVSIDSDLVKQDTLIQYYDTLRYLYSSKNFEPLFIKSFEDENFVHSLLIILEKAEDHGLNSEQYHFSQIVSEFSKAIDTLPNNSRYSHLANTELLISDAILKYSYHLRYGLVKPKEIFSDTYFLPLDDSSKGDLFQPLRQENILQYLSDIEPKSKRYRDLQWALKYYNKFKELDWHAIPIPAKKIEAGATDSTISLIIDRLIKLEYLDTAKVRIVDFDVFDSTLVGYVKQFQINNGLIDDGVLGKNTVERLNITPQQYINTIKVNLERFRWKEYSDTSQYILVNIPDFMLFIIDNGEEIFNSKVCTGIKRSSYYQNQFRIYKKTKQWRDKPDDWETPNMYGEISYMVLNPTWSVPPSIMREEIAYKLKKDSTYLRDKNFKVYKEGVEIDPMTVELAELHSDKIPYRIVQDPGAGNALGKVKFMFNNPFGIYLHDTPNRPPFNKSNRAVSHGCVRVEKPLPLAEFLLRNHSKWNIDYLKIEVGQKVEDKSIVSEYYKKRSSLRKYASLGETTDVILSQKTPVYIDYYTAWVDDEGIINFREDVYNRDKVLLEYLKANKII